jgi:predicted RNA binding protein YcfA (HicA-like mRNA interferase family)
MRNKGETLLHNPPPNRQPGRVTVPHPRKDTPQGTLKSIEKQAGITLKGE